MFSLKDKNLAKEVVSKIKKLNVTLKFMHVCGTHQDTLVKNGLDTLLKKCGVEIGQGPGCPVCVTTPREIEEMLVLARKGITVTSFGDMIRSKYLKPIFGDETYVELIRWYRSQVLGITRIPFDGAKLPTFKPES